MPGLESVRMVKDLMGKALQQTGYWYTKSVGPFLDGFGDARFSLRTIAVHDVTDHRPFTLVGGITPVHEASHSFFAGIVARLGFPFPTWTGRIQFLRFNTKVTTAFVAVGYV